MPPRPVPIQEPEEEELEAHVTHHPDLAADLAEFRNLDLRIKTMERRRDEAKKRLRESLEAEGEPDENGSLWLWVDDENRMKLERRVSEVFNEQLATVVLKRKGLYERCLKTVVVLDEDAVVALGFEGDLSQDVLQTFYEQRVNWAFKGTP